MAQGFLAFVGGKFKQVLSIVTSAGAADSGKIPALGSDGKLDISIMPNPMMLYLKAPYFFDDFAGTPAAPWSGGANGGGTVATAPGIFTIVPGRPGVQLVRSSATANSGYRWSTNNWPFLLGGGEETSVILSPNSSTGTGKVRFGFQDVFTSGNPPDAVVFDINGDGTVGASCWNNNSQTPATAFTNIDKTQFYRFHIKINSVNLVTFSIFALNGTLIESRTLTTGIPTAAGRVTGHGLVAWDTGTTAADVCFVDFMDLYTPGLPRA